MRCASSSAEYNERYEATVILTSHYMDDVVALCPRVIVIDQGKLRFDGPLDGSPTLDHEDDGPRQARLEHHDAARPEGRRRSRSSAAGSRRTASRDLAAERAIDDVIGHLFSVLKATDLAIEDPPARRPCARCSKTKRRRSARRCDAPDRVALDMYRSGGRRAGDLPRRLATSPLQGGSVHGLKPGAFAAY